MNEETPKRKRGRPRKNTIEGKPVVKKKRGRPPKKRTKDPIIKKRSVAVIAKELKRGRGRPTAYREEYNELAYNYCLLGAKDAELAAFFEVEQKTIDNWKKEYPEFLRSLKNGREKADAEVGERLYQRAMGYSHPEDKIFNHNGVPLVVPTIKHYPPDTTAAIFWLKNRQPDKWRDKREVAGDIKVSDLSEQELDAKLRSIIVPMTEDEHD